MYRILNYFFALLICCATSSFAQYDKYVVKVKLDSDKKVKGKLIKVTSEEIIIEDFKFNSHVFSAQNIQKIKVKTEGLTVLGGLGIGAGVGFITSNRVFKDVHSASERIVGGFLVVSAGMLAGSITGLIVETINTKLILHLNNDALKFEKEYEKLEKYSKTYDHN